MLLTVISLLVTAIIALYYFSKRKFNYWKKQNVPYIKPSPILGNYADFILLKKHARKFVRDLCKKFPEEPYFGAFFGTEPTLIVKDPELLKVILTKDFYYFNGREISYYVHKELFTQNLFNNNGDEWKVLRQNLTPVFTSAKMRNMFPLIANCSHELEKLFDTETKISNVLEVRPLIIRFTIACIVSCGFGVDSDTLGKDYQNNPFIKIGDSFFSRSRKMALKAFFREIWPAIFYGLGLKVTPPGTDEFFKDFLREIFEARNYKPTSRNDFVDFIMTFKEKSHLVGDSISNLKTGENKKVELSVTEELLMSQCIIFFLAGFETSATTASFTMYELAKNPEEQKKVQKEIDAYLQKYENKITYDIVNELPYTWACVEETLRLYPILPLLIREVVEDYTLPSGVHLEKGVRVHIPVYDLHLNPKYYPEPEAYRPERFFGDERRNIVPYSYMPFGEGSRICIGLRFAKMQVLAGLMTILKKCDIELDDKTQTKLDFDPNIIIPTPKESFKLKFTPREGWQNKRFVRN